MPYFDRHNGRAIAGKLCEIKSCILHVVVVVGVKCTVATMCTERYGSAVTLRREEKSIKEQSKVE